MLRRIEFASAAVLIAVGMLWDYAGSPQLPFSSILCAGSILAVYHAMRAHKSLMAWEFVGVALLFNPFLPFVIPSGESSLVMAWISIGLIVTCLIAVKRPTAFC
jgi:hypothetical protein